MSYLGSLCGCLILSIILCTSLLALERMLLQLVDMLIFGCAGWCGDV